MTCQWRPIPGYEGIYEIGNDGRIRSLKRLVKMPNGSQRLLPGRLLKWRVDHKSTGYIYATLCKDGAELKCNVHQLVLLAFVGVPPAGCWALHCDGDRSNPSLDNLYYGTPKQNSVDMVKHGNSVRGEKNKQSKLPKDLIEGIRMSPFSSILVGKILGLHGSTIRSIRTGRNWGWL